MLIGQLARATFFMGVIVKEPCHFAVFLQSDASPLLVGHGRLPACHAGYFISLHFFAELLIRRKVAKPDIAAKIAEASIVGLVEVSAKADERVKRAAQCGFQDYNIISSRRGAV